MAALLRDRFAILAAMNETRSTSTSAPQQLVLIGGGHSHALVLKHWRETPLPGVKLTLVSPQPLTPYSGMLPGLVAGHYSVAQAHIDLPTLCRSAGAEFIEAAATGLDLEAREVHFADLPPLRFDLLSINSGIGPDLSVPGAAEFATPVKPIGRLYGRWQGIRAQLAEAQERQVIGVVGGGAAGVELVQALQQAVLADPAITVAVDFVLVQKNTGLPEGYPARLQRKLARLFEQKQIQVRDGFAVAQVTADGLLSENGERLPLGHIFWCTQARPADWLADTGLALDPQGFIALNDYLQSTSHSCVFAAGDIAQQEHHPRPHAGVFAVRQGPVLFDNLCRALSQQPLQAYVPQHKFLSLLSCGDRRGRPYALGCRLGGGDWVLGGKWVWHWKDRIDQAFMALFD